MTEPMPMPPPEKGEEAALKAKKSKGERTFDRITYVGIAGIGTFIMTVPLAYELEHHPKLKPLFEKTVGGLETVFNKVGLQTSHKTARGVVKTTTLMQGGNLMLAPVWLMEHFKRPIVHHFNSKAGDITPADKIQEAPKQTVGSLIKSRALAWVTVFASLTAVEKLYKDTLPKFEEETGKLFCKVLHRSEQRINTGKLLEDTRTFGYGKIAALDIFATAAAATLLYIGGHFFARKHEEKIGRREERKFVKNEMPLRDAASDEFAERTDSPTVQVAGAKQHDGMARDAVLSQQV